MNQCVKKALRLPLLSRLRKDAAGNTLAIAAVAMVPVTAMIGSGVDLSRGYLGQSKLQQACDAGVLAGRRLVSATDTTVTTTVRDETRKYFNYNWPSGTLGSPSFIVTPTLDENSQLEMSVSTTVPTMVMGMFGKDTMEIAATCSSRDDYSNIDLMLVLDTTRSMGCLPSDSPTTGCTPEVSGSKIAGLRAAVLQLYDTMKPIETEFNKQTDLTKRKRIRWGIVPYSMTVNVGRTLYEKNSAWLQTTSKYRKADNTNPSVAHTTAWMNPSTGTWDGCIEERQTVQTITSTSGYTIPTGAKDLDVDTAPDGTEAMKWIPMDPTAQTAGDAGGTYSYACPKEIRELSSLPDRTTLETYLSATPAKVGTTGKPSGFIQLGATYHDIGMIWAARFFSRTGMWSTNNPAIYNTYPVQRHVIFMTDGDLDPNVTYYTAYGTENKDKRVTSGGTDTAATASHKQRFLMMCNKVKSMDVKVWMIAFGTTLTDDMKSCSSGSGYYFQAANSAALATYFKNIGENIGSLRLSQ